MSPAVAPAFQVGGAGAAVGGEDGGDFGDAEFADGGFDDHLAGEFHAGALEVEGEGGSRGGSLAGRSGSRRRGCGRRCGRWR